MTMHIVGPWLSTTGKRRGKTKFRNAEQAKRARDLAAEWERKQAEWSAMSKPAPKTVNNKLVYNLAAPAGRSTAKLPSLNTHVTGAVTSKPSQQYTGTKMIGIGTLHKSNAVPIFTDQEAEDIAKMRR